MTWACRWQSDGTYSMFHINMRSADIACYLLSCKIGTTEYYHNDKQSNIWYYYDIQDRVLFIAHYEDGKGGGEGLLLVFFYRR